MIRSPIQGLLFTGLSAVLAAESRAQGLLSTQGTIVAADGDAVPGPSGAPMPGLSFGGSGALGDNPVVDESGRLLFRGRISGGTQTATTERAHFYGSSRADLRMVVRGGDQAPGMPAGIVLAINGGAVASLSGVVRLSPDGRMWWGSYLNDPVGGTIDSTHDEGVFGGFFGAQAKFVQQGDAAPGTVGATFVQTFTSPSLSTTGINREGRIYFQGTLTGGDVVGTLNQAGLWSGLPGALELVARRGSAAPGIAGAEISTASLSLGSIAQMNDAGRLLYQVTLSTSAGASPATDADDVALMVHTPGSGSAVLVREGDSVPGTSNGSSLATFNASSGDNWTPGISPNAWTRTGETLFKTELRGGDALASTNDLALCRAGVGAPVIVARRGAAAPGTNALFEDWSTASLGLSASGRVCCQATLAGGTSTTGDDTGIWTGFPGTLQLVLREGTVLSGTGGSMASHLGGGQLAINDLGQLLFPVTLVGGAVVGNSLWAWDPALGLQPIVLPGDTLETSAGIFKTIASFAWVSNNDAAGAALGFGHDGRIALRVAFTDGTGAIVTMRLAVAISSGMPYCFGDGSGTACPCGNSGAPGNGCANSIQAAGAHLLATGWPRLSSDTLRLLGSGMPNNSALYFQGTSQQSGGLGVALGDGLRCAGGAVVRLATKPNMAGASTYPSPTEPRISVRGLVTGPGTRTYQVWYRNAAAYCTAATYNLSNAIEVVWIP
ncbi:MAG: hypothetical protein NTY35_02715 [Planctomycetota bacterium]|nr:hypothetical protein [Planctomycetota bacterium]